MKVLILSGPNHQFEKSAPIIHDFLAARGDMGVRLTDDKDVLASPELSEFDVCVLGTGFTRSVRQPDGSVIREPELTSAQQTGLFQVVSSAGWSVRVTADRWA